MSTTVVVTPTAVAIEAKKPEWLDEEKKSWDNLSSSAEVVNYDQGVDVAVDLVAGEHADDAPIHPEVARRIRSKIDWHLLPLLFLLYTCQFPRQSSLNVS